MSRAALIKLRDLIGDGLKTENWGAYINWRSRASEFVRGTFGDGEADRFENLRTDNADWWGEGQGRQVGLLDTLEAKLAATEDAMEGLAQAQGVTLATALSGLQSKKVFVVHGHDHGTKEAVARYLEKLGLEAVILHEKANEGQTVIEKIEAHSDVGFAVVLLTPDDLGGANAGEANLKPRARQNVVLELGYFLGKLKRSRVCALYVPGVEIPSDYQGVLYVELDAKGAWRMQLAQELSNARLPINVAGLLNS